MIYVGMDISQRCQIPDLTQTNLPLQAVRSIHTNFSQDRIIFFLTE